MEAGLKQNKIEAKNDTSGSFNMVADSLQEELQPQK